MDRADARALVEETLDATNNFAAIFQGAPDAFGGQSPVAVISSRSLRLDAVARDLYEVTSGLTVSIYVRRDKDAEAASATEDRLDVLVHATAVALHLTGQFEVGESNADVAGGNVRNIDGVIYRVERIPLTVQDEGGED